jgi:TATA-binding protein-associated factor Taf7
MSEGHRTGYYKDRYGRWQKDRRARVDRRGAGISSPLDHERRRMFRRKVDREVLETDHREMIESALEDFADEHQGHL